MSRIKTSKPAAAPGTDQEGVRDTIAAALVPGANVTITPNDAADTITIAAVGGKFAGTWTAAPDQLIYSEDFSSGTGIWTGTKTAMGSAVGATKPGFAYVDQNSWTSYYGQTSTLIQGSLASIPAASGRTLTRLKLWHAHRLTPPPGGYTRDLTFNIYVDGINKYTDHPSGSSNVDSTWQILEVTNPLDSVQFTATQAPAGGSPWASGQWAITGVELYATDSSWTGYAVDQVVAYKGQLYKSSMNNNYSEPTVGAGATAWSRITNSIIAGTNVTATVDDTAHTVTLAASGSGQGLRDFASSRITSGDIALNSTGAYVNVNTATDLVMTASAGDVIEVSPSVKVTGSGNFAVLDVVTVVGGNPVNSVTTRGAPSLTASGGSWGRGAIDANGVLLTGSRMYQLQAGDISAGTVTLRLRARCGAGTTFTANTDPDLYVQAKNLGPQL